MDERKVPANTFVCGKIQYSCYLCVVYDKTLMLFYKDWLLLFLYLTFEERGNKPNVVFQNKSAQCVRFKHAMLFFGRGEKLKRSYLFEPSLCHSIHLRVNNDQEGILG